jgi:hypothetical protein
LVCYVRIQTDELQQFHLHMDLALREEHFVKFVMRLRVVILHSTYCGQFYCSFCELVQIIDFLWSSGSGQGSWLQIQRSVFDSLRYQIFWEVVGLERGPLNLVSTTEELFRKKNSGSGLENLDYGRKDPSRWLRDTPLSANLTLTSPTNGGRSVGTVRSRTKVTGLL